MRCTKRRKNGEPCHGQAVTGTDPLTCRMHGAGAPQVKRKAAARVAKAKVLAHVDRLIAIDGLADVDPIEYLVEALKRAYVVMLAWGRMAADLDDRAERETAEHGQFRGELRYTPAAEDSYDELIVTTPDRLLAFNYRGEAQIHPYVAEYQQAVDRVAKLAKMCVDAGLAERQIEIAERQAELIADFARSLMADLGVDPASERGRKMLHKHLTVIAGGMAA